MFSVFTWTDGLGGKSMLVVQFYLFESVLRERSGFVD